MFYPEEIIFAPSSRCNLKCPHCFVPGKSLYGDSPVLEVGEACSFLASCLEAGRSDLLVGFSGGEPFLCLDFLCGVSEFAVEAGFLFSRVVTNGVFSRSREEIKAGLCRLRDSGFDGKIALSFDVYHGQNAEDAAFFLQTAMDVFGDSSAGEIWSVIPPEDRAVEFYHVLIKTGEILEASFNPPSVSPLDILTPGRLVLEGRDFFIPVYNNRRSVSAVDLKWDGENWFSDDFCEGPGQCIFVHPDAAAAPCCGFANYRDALKIGHIREGYSALMDNASKSPAVFVCYEKGLGARRSELEAGGFVFPGKTGDICAFCDYLCSIENGFPDNVSGGSNS